MTLSSYAPPDSEVTLLEGLSKPLFRPADDGLKVAHCIDPLKDPRWDELVLRHPRSSLFHSSAWLRALSRTYEYKPVVYTTSPASEELQNGMVFCQVKSWLTGRRLVSLPFSDHCEPLVDTVEDREVLFAALERNLGRERLNYVEIRPTFPFKVLTPYAHTAITYAFHQLYLGPDIEEIFRSFHKSSTQRKIRRAEREGLKYRDGRTEEFLDRFYQLFTVTRRRQGLAPPPKKWFASLMNCFGSALKIRVAFKDEQAIAAMITIRHKDTLTYKYGCSDARFNNLGCMHLLFWNAIKEAQFSGLRFLDFGRTDADQHGLILFKSRWGATQSILTYSRYGESEKSTHLCDLYSSKRKSKMVKSVLKRVPEALLPKIGQIVYGHIG